MISFSLIIWYVIFRKTYTDKCIGETNLKMIEIARKYDSSAKFSGSGGAIVGCCLDPIQLVRNTIFDVL